MKRDGVEPATKPDLCKVAFASKKCTVNTLHAFYADILEAFPEIAGNQPCCGVRGEVRGHEQG